MESLNLTYFVFALQCNSTVLEAILQHYPFQHRMLLACYRTLGPFLDYVEGAVPLIHKHMCYSRSQGDERIWSQLTLVDQGWQLVLDDTNSEENICAIWYPQTLLPPVINHVKRTRRGTRIHKTVLRDRAALIVWLERKLK